MRTDGAERCLPSAPEHEFNGPAGERVVLRPPERVALRRIDWRRLQPRRFWPRNCWGGACSGSALPGNFLANEL